MPATGGETPRESPVSFGSIVTTATRSATSTFESPRAVTAVSPEAIEEQAPGVMPDLLRGQVGVFVQQTTPGQGTPIVRGLMGSAVLVLVDGMRLNSAFFRPAPNQYFSLLDPYHIERLEVVRGTASTLYGSDAMGGVVQVFTPTERFDGEKWQARSRVVTRFQSADLGVTGRVSTAVGRRGVSLAGGVTWQHHGHLRGGGGRQVPTAWEAWAGDAKLRLEDDRQDLTLAVQYAVQPRTPRYDELVPGFGQTQPGSAVFRFEPNDRLFTQARYRRYAPLAGWELIDLAAGFQRIVDDRRTRPFESRQETRERNHSEVVGFTAEALSLPWWRMRFTVGAETYLDSTRSRASGTDLDLGGFSVLPSRYANGARLDSHALYLQDEIALHPRLTATLGARLSYFDLDIPPADRGVGARRRILDPTANLGLVYRALEELHLVASVGRGFRVPNVFDLSSLGPRPGNRYQVPNPALAAEQVIGSDLGLRFRLPRFEGEVFGFHSHYADKIEAVPTGEVTEDGRIVVRSENASRVDLFGVEAGANAALREALTAFAVLNFTWGEERLASGIRGPAERIPPLNGRAGLSWQPWPRFVVEPFLSWAGEQRRLSERDRTDPRINPKGTSGWVAASLRTWWEARPGIVLRLEAGNLFDANYREHGSGLQASGFNLIAGLDLRH